jgi:signal transduction histidine kinase
LPGFAAGAEETGRRPPLHGVLAAPLTARDGAALGLIQVFDKWRGRFTAEDEALLVQLAQLASVAIENVRLYQRAQEALSARDSVLAVVSHDLRDPLNAVVTSTAVLEESCPQEGPARRAVQTIRRSTDQMSRLIRDLLDAARLEEGRLAVEPAPVPVREILDEVYQMFLPRARKGSLHLVREPSDDAEEACVFADRARLVQVIANLLSNAVRMTPAGGSIRLGAHLEDRVGTGAVRFSVADTGPGLSPEQIPHLFRPFRRGRPGGREPGELGGRGGAGLGLAIARGIVEAHGGEIRVETGEGGSGAVFSFDIPRA